MADDDLKKTETGADQKNTEEAEIPQDKYQEIFNKGFKTAEAKLKTKMDEFNSQLNELRQFKAERDSEAENAKLKELEGKAQWEEIKKNLTETHRQEKERLKQQIDERNIDFQNVLIDAEIAKLAAKHGVVPESTDVFMLALRPFMGYSKEENNGRATYKVFPQKDGSPIINPKTGDTMDNDAFAADYLDRNQYFLRTKTDGGSGATGSKGIGDKLIRNSDDAIRIGLEKLMKGK